MKLPLALVGCGHVAQKHLRALVTLHDQVELLGLVDPNPQAITRSQAILPAPGFAHLDELLHAHTPALIVLATPTGLHPRQAIACADAGVDVLTEKPLGTSLSEAHQMVTRFQELHRHLFVVKQLRFHPLFQALHHAVHTGRFGQIHSIALQVFWCRPQAYYDEAPWRGTPELDGGALLNQASHYVDLLDWLFGPVTAVHAIGGAFGRKIEVEDTAILSLRFHNGFLGSLHVSMLASHRNLATSLTILGSEGMVRLDGPRCDQISAWDFTTPDPLDDTIHARAANTRATLQDGHLHVYRAVLNTLQGSPAHIVDGPAALRSLSIIDAAYRSMNAGRTTVPVSPDRP